ncbi:Serine protease inhibitor Kazal-type 5 [Haplosporangium gracile]|nr:Serine protease inhibitor Kazal-type 5 [Haplosporangium gracile]
MQLYSLIILTVAASVAVLSAMAAPAASKCPDVCAAVYQPICAQNLSGDFITFGSPCELNKYTCRNSDAQLTVAYKGACESIALQKRAAAPKCDTVCPTVFQPICAKAKTGLNKVFGNACELNNYNCKHPNANFVLVADSSCEELATPTCNTVCPAIYQPVCGKLLSGDFKTFGNSCELKNYNCEHANAQATAVSNNACASDAVEKRALAAASTKCDDIMCAAVEQPVCAKAKNGLSKNFGNACELKEFNCKHPNAEFVVLAESTCEDLVAPKCDFMCAMVDDPVCATSKDGKPQTFSNACLLDVHNCQNPNATFKLVANVACPAIPVCADACPAVYRPVCAKLQSGKTKTFGNKCEFSAFNCKNPKDAFTFVSEGAC